MIKRTSEKTVIKSSAKKLQDRSHPHMGEPCDICGDVGIKEAIATCSKCCRAREHVYCMRDNATVVPEVWFCEACQSSNDHDDSPKYDEKEVLFNSSDIAHDDPMHLVGTSKVCIDSGRQVNVKRIKTAETGKVKFLEVEEVIRLASGASRKEYPSRRSNEGSKPLSPNSIASLFRRTLIGSKTITPMFTSRNLKPNSTFVHSKVMGPPRQGNVQISSTIGQQVAKTSKKSEEESAVAAPTKEHGCNEQPVDALISAREVETSSRKKDKALKSCAPSPPRPSLPIINSEESAVVAPIKEHGCKEQPVDALLSAREVETLGTKKDKALKSCAPSLPRPSLPIINSDRNFHIAAEPRNSDVEERDPLNILPTLRLYRPYLPALHATWKGGFKFPDTAIPGEFYGGFLGQPPCRVHRKAYEFSQKMPIVLQVKLLPRGHLLADLFNINCPDLHDIALYFFPADNIERSKLNHVCLFELMENQNSVMRSYIDGMELLMFTSKHLHEDLQNVIRMSKKVESFLWGVFRHAKNDQIPHKASLLSPPECAHHDHTNMDNSEVTDMDIDMVGGRVVGNVDIAVQSSLGKLPTSMDEFNIPQGFGARLKSTNIFWKANVTEEKSCLVDGRVVSHVTRDNASPPGVFGGTSQPSGPRSQRSMEDSNLIGSEKHDQEPAPDMANDPLAASPPPSSEKVMRNGSDILDEGNADETPAKMGETKGLEDTSFFNEASSRSTMDSFKDEVHAIHRDGHLQCHTVEVKAKVQGLEHDRLGFSCELYTRSPREMEIPIRWIPPPKNWVKLNTDVSSKGNPGAAGVIRDESGKWVLGYIVNLKTCVSLEAEFWALFQGLKLLWDRGYRRVLVESVSCEAVKSLKNAPSEFDSNRPIIECCRDLLKRDWECKIYLISREQNLCANWLATHFEDYPSGVIIYEKPPCKLIPILQNDCIGVVQQHSCFYSRAETTLDVQLKN